MEILGFIFVGLIAWSLLRGVFNGAVKGHMMRSVDYAVSRGVPRDFVLKKIQQNGIMKQAIKLMRTQIPEFKLKDVYEQQGEALRMIYEGSLNEEKSVDVARILQTALESGGQVIVEAPIEVFTTYLKNNGSQKFSSQKGLVTGFLNINNIRRRVEFQYGQIQGLHEGEILVSIQ
ncbi:hypothetical protein [Desulfobacula sp.]|uniref:hypothetical protein n=1 Tax=Desulfobacula sp. TaxID=2593537 RepID=UPI001EBDE9D5|nr:hypothetical protein [Desulfobacula sp.]